MQSKNGTPKGAKILKPPKNIKSQKSSKTFKTSKILNPHPSFSIPPKPAYFIQINKKSD